VSKTTEVQGFYLTVILVALGSFFGVTGAKRTLVKNLSVRFEGKTNENDPLSIAWRIILSKFRTYVNEPTEKDKPLPSVKYGSALADFTLMGMMIVVAKTLKFSDIAAVATRKVKDWPEVFQKQWIGNFYLAAEFQDEHEEWEKIFWSQTVSSTKNTSNTTFKSEFKEEFYKTTRADNILFLTPQGGRVIPEDNAKGYTKEEFVKYVFGLYKLYNPVSLEASNDTAWNNNTKLSVDTTNNGNMLIENFITVNNLQLTSDEQVMLTNAPAAEVAPVATSSRGLLGGMFGT
jgi:hypothetical protein